MATISVEVPDYIINKFGISNNISYDKLIIKTIWKDYISPDLRFTSIEDMSENHKKLYNDASKIDKSNLVNI